MSESVIYDARFLCDVRLSSLRASSHCLNLHPISPWPRPWTQTSPSAKTTLRSKTACGMYPITYSLLKLARGHVFFSGATRNGVLALRMGDHEMVEVVGD